MDEIRTTRAEEYCRLLETNLRELQSRVLGFRNLIKIESIHTLEIDNMLSLYDRWFDITDKRIKTNE
jgi:hypothetical protein